MSIVSILLAAAANKKNIICPLILRFEDVLEIPLQPLYDNLDCYTYEIFEKDPVKYKLYQDAVAAALVDRVPQEMIEGTTVNYCLFVYSIC